MMTVSRKYWAVFLLAACFIPQVESQIQDKRRLVCYYTNWAQYRPRPVKFFPENVDPSLCTHLVYAFASLQGNEIIAYEWSDESISWMKGMYERFNDLKKINNGLRTLLAIGGWSMGSEGFSRMVSKPQNRNIFIASVIKFLRKNGFDGLDIDWEYPGIRGGSPTDKDMFSVLLAELSFAFEEESKIRGVEKLLLSAAVGTAKKIIDTAYDVPILSRYLDFITIMTYDFHGSWEDKTGHNSPLQASIYENRQQSQLNLKWAANYWVKKGADSRKLNIGLPTYARTYTLSNSANSELGAPVLGPGSPGRYTKEKGLLSFYEVCQELKKRAKVHWLNDQNVPYAVLDDQWMGYDDPTSIRIKSRWIKRNDFGGAAVWSLALDDFTGKFCNNEKFPLIRVAAEELNGYRSTTTTTTTMPPSTTTIAIWKPPQPFISSDTRSNSFRQSDFRSSSDRFRQSDRRSSPDHFPSSDRFPPSDLRPSNSFSPSDSRPRDRFSPSDPRASDRFSPTDPRASDRFSPTDPRASDRFSPSDPRALDRFSPSDPRASDRFSPTDPRASDRFSPSDPRASDRFSPSDPRASDRFSPSDPRASDRFSPSDPRASDRFSPSDPRASDRFSPSDNRPSQRFLPSDPLPSDRFPPSDPRPSDRFPSSDPRPSDRFPPSDPRPSDRFPSSDPRPSDRFPSSDPRPSDRFPPSDPRPSDRFPSSDPRPSDRFPPPDPRSSDRVSSPDLRPSDRFPSSEPLSSDRFSPLDSRKTGDRIPLLDSQHSDPFSPSSRIKSDRPVPPDTSSGSISFPAGTDNLPSADPRRQQPKGSLQADKPTATFDLFQPTVAPRKMNDPQLTFQDDVSRNLPSDSSKTTNAFLTPGVNKNTADFSCVGLPNGMHASPVSCNEYIVCDVNSQHTGICANGLEWNNAKKYCDWPNDAGCSIERSAWPTSQPDIFLHHTTTDITTSVKLPSFVDPDYCRTVTDGHYRNSVDCSYYYNCHAGKTYHGKCADGTIFHEEIGGCDHATNVPGC